MKNKWVIVSALAVAALFAACSPTASTPTFVPAPTDTSVPTLASTAEVTAESTTEAGSTNPNLAGTSWQLTSISGTAPIAGTQVTLVFDATTLSGKSCNSYTGSYTASNGKFAVTNLTNTLVSCLQPAGLQDQETAYFNDLRQATIYKISANTLSIGSDADPAELMFAETSAPTASTTGTTGATTNGTGSSGSTSSSPAESTLELAPSATPVTRLTGTATATP